MSHEDAIRKAHLREAIIQHLLGNLFAADTVEGIISCWLPKGQFEHAADDIEAVLEELVADHWLIPAPLPGGDKLYITNLAKCSTLPSSSSPPN